MTRRNYFTEQIYSLKPTYDPATDPLTLLRLLSKKQWAFFLIGFFAWTVDGFDFYTVSVSYSSLGNTFHKDLADLTMGVTLVMMLRPLGAGAFGLAADRFGRKWPFIINCLLLIVFELSTGFCKTYKQFLAVRALFGIAMGGIYGNATTTALEDCPDAARGFLSGIFQSGYPFGILLATVFWEAFNGRTAHEWRPLFWLGACLPVFLIISRFFMPETEKYKLRSFSGPGKSTLKGTLVEFKEGLVRHWLLLIYLALLMTGLSYLSHGTQDLYPTMLLRQYHYSPGHITLIQVTACLGGLVGGTIGGYCSQIFGRRFSIIVLCVIGCPLLYPYTIVSGRGVYVSAFFEQLCVQGIFGIVPIHLLELAPPTFSTFVVGTSYNLGVLIASASNTIETKIAERMGNDYGKAILIFIACVYAYVIVVTMLGPEKRMPLQDQIAWDNNGHDEGHRNSNAYNMDLWGFDGKVMQSSTRPALDSITWR